MASRIKHKIKPVDSVFNNVKTFRASSKLVFSTEATSPCRRHHLKLKNFLNMLIQPAEKFMLALVRGPSWIALFEKILINHLLMCMCFHLPSKDHNFELQKRCCLYSLYTITILVQESIKFTVLLNPLAQCRLSDIGILGVYDLSSLCLNAPFDESELEFCIVNLWSIHKCAW